MPSDRCHDRDLIIVLFTSPVSRHHRVMPDQCVCVRNTNIQSPAKLLQFDTSPLLIKQPILLCFTHYPFLTCILLVIADI